MCGTIGTDCVDPFQSKGKLQKLHLAVLSGNEEDAKRILNKGVGAWFHFSGAVFNLFWEPLRHNLISIRLDRCCLHSSKAATFI